MEDGDRSSPPALSAICHPPSAILVFVAPAILHLPSSFPLPATMFLNILIPMDNPQRTLTSMIEELERRTFRDATLVNGIITVTGTPGDDIVVVRIDPSDTGAVLVAVNEQAPASFQISDATGISIDTGDGNDRIGFDQSNGIEPPPTT